MAEQPATVVPRPHGGSYTVADADHNAALKKNRKKKKGKGKGTTPSVESSIETASCWSILSFSWISPLLRLGAERIIVAGDIPPLPAADCAVRRYERLCTFLDLAGDKCYHHETVPDANKSIMTEQGNASKAVDETLRRVMKAATETKQERSRHVDRVKFRPNGDGWALICALFKSNASHIVCANIFLAIVMITIIAIPLIVREFVSFLEQSAIDGSEPAIWNGYAYAGSLTFVALLNTVSLNRFFFKILRISIGNQAAVMFALFDKALKLAPPSRNDSKAGEAVNLLASDSERIFLASTFCYYVIHSCYTVAILMVLLFVELGVSASLGVALMCFAVPLQMRLAQGVGNVRRKTVAHTDERVRALQEAFRGIRTVKMHGWESVMFDKISSLRVQELRESIVGLYYRAGNLTFAFSINAFVSLATLGLYTILGNNLDAPTTFAVLSIIQGCRYPLALLPHAVQLVAEARVSASRIETFLLSPEVHSRNRSQSHGVGSLKDQRVVNVGDDIVLHICQGVFAWSASSRPVLFDVNLRIRRGHIVAVVGPVGAGKSSLLAAILGELHNVSSAKGHVYDIHVDHSLCMLQRHFIQNATVLDNVLFGLPMDDVLFEKAVWGAAFDRDIQLFPSHERTEIGERGISLSGGQKARLSFARVLYRVLMAGRIGSADRHILLLDTPFAAVDASVAITMVNRGVFDILRGLGCTILLVMNSHLQLLRRFDDICVVDYRVLDDGAAVSVEKDDGEVSSGHIHRCMSTMSRSAGYIAAYGPYDKVVKEKSVLWTLLREVKDNPSGGEHVPEVAQEASSTVPDSDVRACGVHVPLVQEEERSTGRVDTGVYMKYLSAAAVRVPALPSPADHSNSAKLYSDLMTRGGMLILFLLVCGYICATALLIFANVWLTMWLDDPLHEDHELSYWLGFYAAFVCVAFVAALGRNMYYAKVASKASNILHIAATHALLNAPIHEFFDVTPIGRVMNRLSRDMDIVDIDFNEISARAMQNTFELSGALVIIVIASPLLVFPLSLMVILFFKVQFYFRRSSRELKRVAGTMRSPVLSLFEEAMDGLVIIRAFEGRARYCTRFAHAVDASLRASVSTHFANRWLSLRLDTLSACIILVTSVALVLGRGSNVSFASLALISSLRFTSYLQYTVRILVETEDHATAVERILALRDVPQEAAGGSGTFPPVSHAAKSPQSTNLNDGSVQFMNFSAKYRQDLPLAVENVAFQVPHGAKVGIVGRTGSGKSTLMLALLRIIEPQTGTVLIGGIDVQKVSLYALRRCVAVVPQDPVIFTATVRDNIAPRPLGVDKWDNDADKSIWSALKMVHLDEIVEELGGLDVMLAGDHCLLSFGQRQLLCIARAIVKSSPLILCDEPTAYVDMATDSVIQRTIREAFRNCTVLTIAHRIETIADADLIIKMDNGHLVAGGDGDDAAVIPHASTNSEQKSQPSRWSASDIVINV